MHDIDRGNLASIAITMEVVVVVAAAAGAAVVVAAGVRIVSIVVVAVVAVVAVVVVVVVVVVEVVSNSSNSTSSMKSNCDRLLPDHSPLQYLLVRKCIKLLRRKHEHTRRVTTLDQGQHVFLFLLLLKKS